MKKFIHSYKNPNEDRMNYGLINREYDSDLIELIVDCCKSLEVLEYIEFLGYEYVTDETMVDTSEYISAKSRDKGSRRNARKRTRYMHLEESRYAELKLKFRLTCVGDDKGMTKGKSEIVTKDITKKILVPIPDNNNYYKIKGTKYFLMYQVVDNSTYTTKKTLVLKSMMPISLQVKKVSHTNTNGITYSAPIYTVNLFRKSFHIMLLYIAKMGIDKTLEYFSLTRIVRFTSTIDTREGYMYFPISSKMFIEVNEYFFNRYQYTRTMVFMLLEIMSNRVNHEILHDKTYWVEAIGAVRTTIKTSQREKGMSTLTFFDRMLDNTTKKVLKLHPVHTKDVYAVLRWMLMHFDDLRKKDNLDLNNRRLRCNEYIAALLTRTFGERVNRIISHGSKTTMKNVEDIFKFSGDILITQLHNSGLLRFDDRINDMDFFGKLKITMKGPNSLGQTNANNIAGKFRGLDPSYIGRIDLNVCGTSDPGTSATLSPFCKVKGLYFDDSRESEDFKYTIDKDILEYIRMQAANIVASPDFSSVDSYYDYALGNEKVNDLLTSDMTINNLHMIEIPDPDSEDDSEDDELDDEFVDYDDDDADVMSEAVEETEDDNSDD